MPCPKLYMFPLRLMDAAVPVAEPFLSVGDHPGVTFLDNHVNRWSVLGQLFCIKNIV